MANTFTPTAASAAVAGFGFWALVWSIALKIDTILALFGFHSNYSKRIRVWINANKALTLCITEVFNFSIHGITNPDAVTFAIGGTLFNFFYVLLINPLLCLKDRKKARALKVAA